MANMKASLLTMIICVWILNNQAKVSCQRQNRNFKDEALNDKWISEQRQKKHFYYPKHHKRENGGQIKSNLSDVPYAVGMEEALFFRHHYFRENDNPERRLIPDRDYNNVHLTAHRMKIMNGHRVVPHHLGHNEPTFDRPEGYIGSHFKSFLGNDSSDGTTTTMRSGIRGKFQNLGHQIKRLFVKKQSSENATTAATSRNSPKHRKRSEFELIPKWEPTRKPSIADEMRPYGSEEGEFVNRFVMPRVAQLSLHEKSSGKFDKNFHFTCEKDAETQHIRCKSSEINIIGKEEDSELHSNPDTKTRILNIPVERNKYDNFKHRMAKNDDYIDQTHFL